MSVSPDGRYNDVSIDYKPSSSIYIYYNNDTHAHTRASRQHHSDKIIFWLKKKNTTDLDLRLVVSSSIK